MKTFRIIALVLSVLFAQYHCSANPWEHFVTDPSEENYLECVFAIEVGNKLDGRTLASDLIEAEGRLYKRFLRHAEKGNPYAMELIAKLRMYDLGETPGGMLYTAAGVSASKNPEKFLSLLQGGHEWLYESLTFTHCYSRKNVIRCARKNYKYRLGRLASVRDPRLKDEQKTCLGILEIKIDRLEDRRPRMYSMGPAVFMSYDPKRVVWDVGFNEGSEKGWNVLDERKIKGVKPAMEYRESLGKKYYHVISDYQDREENGLFEVKFYLSRDDGLWHADLLKGGIFKKGKTSAIKEDAWEQKEILEKKYVEGQKEGKQETGNGKRERH